MSGLARSKTQIRCAEKGCRRRCQRCYAELSDNWTLILPYGDEPERWLCEKHCNREGEVPG